MSVFDATDLQVVMRKLNSSVHTLYSIAAILEEMVDPEDADQRADLVLTCEELAEIANFVLERSREIAWQYTPVPEREDPYED